MRFAQNLGIQHNGAPRPNTTNAEGHPAFRESLKQSIARVAFTGVLADQFYGKEEQQAKELIPLILDAVNKEPDFLLKAAQVSRKANFKLFPKLALGGLMGSQAWKKIEPQAQIILGTYGAGQLLELALLLKSREMGHGLGARAQRVLGNALVSKSRERLEDMTLQDRQDMRRLLRLLHPKGFNPEQAALLRYVLGDDPVAVTERQKAMESLKGGFWDQAKMITDHRLPFNATKGFANADPKTWEAIRDNMSPLQILLNLKALDERGVIGPTILESILGKVDLTKTRLIPHDILRPLGMATAKYSEVLIRFLARLASQPIPGLEDKRVGILMDFSGSMAPGFQANSLGKWILAVTLAAPIMATCPSRHLAFFGPSACFEGQTLDQTVKFPYLKGCPTEAAFHNLLGLTPCQSTNIPAGIELFNANNIPLDVLFLFTDEQQNGHPLGGQAWNTYRGRINPKAKLVVVNVSNTKWHMADSGDPSISIIQSITPLIYHQFSNFDQSAVEMIEEFTSL